MRKYNKLLPILIPIIAMLIFVSVLNEPSQSKAMISDMHKLQVHFLDVGQADCILIQFPDGKTSLIDGGNRSDEELIINYLKKLSVKKIDYLIATHPHEDHIGGLPSIVRTFDIGSIYMPKVSANTKIFEDFLAAVKSKGIKITTAKAGVVIQNQPGLTFSLIAPNSEHYDDTNEYSAVARLVYGDTVFLFAGDADQVSEKEILETGADVSAAVLKVGHHGAKTSTTNAFLKAVNPKYAVISVGNKNDYGHPSIEALDRLQSQNAIVLRTDIEGTIVLTSDGKKVSIER